MTVHHTPCGSSRSGVANFICPHLQYSSRSLWGLAQAAEAPPSGWTLWLAPFPAFRSPPALLSTLTRGATQPAIPLAMRATRLAAHVGGSPPAQPAGASNRCCLSGAACGTSQPPAAMRMPGLAVLAAAGGGRAPRPLSRKAVQLRSSPRLAGLQNADNGVPAAPQHSGRPRSEGLQDVQQPQQRDGSSDSNGRTGKTNGPAAEQAPGERAAAVSVGPSGPAGGGSSPPPSNGGPGRASRQTASQLAGLHRPAGVVLGSAWLLAVSVQLAGKPAHGGPRARPAAAAQCRPRHTLGRPCLPPECTPLPLQACQAWPPPGCPLWPVVAWALRQRPLTMPPCAMSGAPRPSRCAWLSLAAAAALARLWLASSYGACLLQ